MATTLAERGGVVSRGHSAPVRMSASVSDQAADFAEQVLAHAAAVAEMERQGNRAAARTQKLVDEREELSRKIAEHELERMKARVRAIDAELSHESDGMARMQGHLEGRVRQAVPMRLNRMIDRLRDRHKMLSSKVGMTREEQSAIFTAGTAALQAAMKLERLRLVAHAPQELDAILDEAAREGGLV